MNSMINAECTISAQLFPSALMTQCYCQNGSFAKIIQSEKNVDFFVHQSKVFFEMQKTHF